MQPLNLALQGGGALGAITWGVLDRLLEEPDLRFGAASGASAGAMNAVALAHGWAEGGADGARRSLATFWQAVGKTAQSVPMPAPFLLGLTRFFTPQQLNPFDINPLRVLVTRLFDFERLRRASPLRLFIAATHVRSGRLRVFTETELTAEHLLASACLPALHHPVLIDGEDYWDGGYSGNPPLFPLVQDCEGDDLLVVPLLPHSRDEMPATVDAIRARLAEIQFNAVFDAELRDLAYAIDVARGAWWPYARDRRQRRLRALRLHIVNTDAVSRAVDSAQALRVGPELLDRLRDQGRACAASWLEQHRSALGRHASVDLSRLGRT